MQHERTTPIIGGSLIKFPFHFQLNWMRGARNRRKSKTHNSSKLAETFTHFACPLKKIYANLSNARHSNKLLSISSHFLSFFHTSILLILFIYVIDASLKWLAENIFVGHFVSLSINAATIGACHFFLLCFLHRLFFGYSINRNFCTVQTVSSSQQHNLITLMMIHQQFIN